MANPRPADTEVIADYTRFDFESLWRRREKVTQVETELLRSLMGTRPRARVLEIGTGFGRLTPTIRSLADEYVGVDFDPKALLRTRGRFVREENARARWVLANLHHLPFAPGSFSAVVMIRVAHHVPRWEETARQMAALLSPGGRYIVTVNPSPTVGTLVEDVKQTFRGERTRPASTWARGEDVQVSTSPHPIYVGSRNGYRRGLERAGLRISAELGSGLEELVPGIPARGWVGLAPMGEPLPCFPTKWYAADRPGSTDRPLPPIDSILVCPRCQAPLPSGSFDPGPGDGCAQCGLSLGSVDGLRDLRYVSKGAVRIGPPLTPG